MSFNFKSFWGPTSLIPRVTFSRNGQHYCIYCGKPSNTREHSPSKVFLEKPYPDDLPVLPACSSCNNGFSSDELYTKMYIDSLEFCSGIHKCLSQIVNKHIDENTAFIDAKKDYEYYKNSGLIPNRNKLLRIITKLAICHLVYELYECYSIDGCMVQPSMVKYSFLFDNQSDITHQIKEPILLSRKPLPMVGSRVYEHIYVCEPMLPHKKPEPFLILNWTDIQPNYSYVTWFDSESTYKVKILINNFMFAEIDFPQQFD